MKKFISALVCAIMVTVLFFGFSACADVKQTDKVNLVAINGVQVGTTDNIDFYVVPEPAATAKVNAVKDLKFVGDLQQLYGGENGYPQAVAVVKNHLLDSDFCARFSDKLTESANWLLSADTKIVADAVQSHLTVGMTPTFNAGNLTAQVIKSCGVRFTYGESNVREIIDFVDKLNSVSETSFGNASENFFIGNVYPDALYSGKVKVYAPDGAPALALAKLMTEETAFGDSVEAEYNVVDASTIQTYVTGANPAADICVLPVNLAVKLLGSGEKYKLLGTLTHGNLYILSKDGTPITRENISSLKGKTVGVVNLASVPGLTFKLILKNSGVEYTEVR